MGSRSVWTTSGSPGRSSTGTRSTRRRKSRRSANPGVVPGSASSSYGRAGSTSGASRSWSSIASSWSGRRGRPGMALAPSDTQRLMLSTIARLMDRFPPDYWKGLEERESYPEAFVAELEAQGFGGLLIPSEYGGAGGSLSDAAVVLEEIHARGGNAQPFHGQFYLSFLVSRFASDAIRRKFLPDLAQGKLRMQSFALTEPDAGSDLARIATVAERQGDRYRIQGHKVFISRVEQSDLMVLVARTPPLEEGAKRTEGLSLFLVDLREAKGIEHTRIRTMFNSQTYELFLNDVEVPVENRIGEEGRGFEPLLHVLNPERILIASECTGQAANVAMDVHGGYGMARDMHIERKMRETRLYQVAPVSNNLVLAHIAHQVLGLPRSY